jgi:hypothetical protein
MPYGTMTPEMEETIRPYVAGRRVWDVGAGDLTYAHRLLDLGADVIAADKEYILDATGIRTYRGTFAQMAQAAESFPVAFVSWPPNHPCQLDRVTAKTDVVIYLGQNSRERGTACGGPGFWGDVSRRPVLAIVEHPQNTLIVYGPGEDHTRDMLDEEREAYEQWFPGLIRACEEF